MRLQAAAVQSAVDPNLVYGSNVFPKREVESFRLKSLPLTIRRGYVHGQAQLSESL